MSTATRIIVSKVSHRSSSSSSSSIHILKVRHESRVESTNDHRKHSHCCSSLPTGTRTQTWHCTKVRNGINYTGRNKTTPRMQQTTPKHTTKLKHRTHIQNGCDHGDVNVHSAATISCPAIIIVILTSTTEHQTAIQVPLRMSKIKTNKNRGR